MAIKFDDVLVIGIASSALFYLAEGHEIFETQGRDAYQAYQREHRDEILEPGPAFSFIKKLLALNDLSDEKDLVDVVLLSRNSPDTGYRVMKSIKHYGLDVNRAAFTQGESPFVYHRSFGIDLFLSENDRDVREANSVGCPAGRVFTPTKPNTAPNDSEMVRLAFDFDGVIGDDSSEQIYKDKGLPAFREYEFSHQNEPVKDGPLKAFFMAIAHIQKLDRQRARDDETYERRLRTSIVTARNSPAEMRVLTTLEYWGVDVDDAFFLGGIEKGPVLEVLGPDIFFDDQLTHIESAFEHTLSAHVIFGVRNDPLLETDGVS
ncbi:5'-nucleotidase [Glutamicibacter arilaitensis]|uniref:5'-nucleotidase n=1 Tax=Glutamicibacter arilaitensis TaxID=256701 RepID=UPI000FB419DD